MGSLRERLRTIPSFPAELAVLDPETAPHNPHELFLTWLDDAIATQPRQANATALCTARPDGTPVARTLILKDVDDRGYHFATHRTSRKGRELARNPRASLLFFWSATGRQVRLTGTVAPLGEDESQADWRLRPQYANVPNPSWQLYALAPDEFEFLQARHDRNHTRVVYRSRGAGWIHSLAHLPGG